MGSANRKLLSIFTLAAVVFLVSSPMAVAQIDDSVEIDPCALITSLDIAAAFEDPAASWTPFLNRDGGTCTWSPQNTPEYGHVVIYFAVLEAPSSQRQLLQPPVSDAEGVGDEAYFSVREGQVDLIALKGRAITRLAVDQVQNDPGLRTIEAAQALALIALDNAGDYPIKGKSDTSSDDTADDGFDYTGLITAAVAAVVAVGGLTLFFWGYSRLRRQPVPVRGQPPVLEPEPTPTYAAAPQMADQEFAFDDRGQRVPEPVAPVAESELLVVEPEPDPEPEPVAGPEPEPEPVVQKVKARPAKSRAPRRPKFPIEDYETLTVKEILARLPELRMGELLVVQARESVTKKRATILNRIDAIVAAARKRLDA